jgi:predicted nucleic acid-binding Zn ribbon protein
MSEKPLRTCPQCKKRKIQRLISGGAGFLFKGSGFYITDNRSDAYKTAAKKDKEASGSSSPKEPKKEAA